MTKYTHFQKKNIVTNQRFFKPTTKYNHYDVNKGESEQHDKEILLQFFELRRRNHFVCVRGKLLNGKIPDLAVLDTPEIIFKEIMFSETDERCEAKEYPGRILKVKIKKKLIE